MKDLCVAKASCL